MTKNWLQFSEYMQLPFVLIQDFLIATTALLDRFIKSPYLLIKASNDFTIDQKGFIKITKKVLVSYLIIFIAFSGTGLFFLFNPFTRSAEAAWFNDNWLYRKAITMTIDSQSAARSNVYALVTLNTNLTSTKLQSACQDLRFTDINGNVIPYYIPNTSSCNTNATNQIWLLIPSVPASTTSYIFYMYYGNPSAVTGSNIAQLPLIDGLQGYWKLNESSSTAADSSINTNTLTNNNTTTYTTGQFGNSASFASASSQSLSIADSSQTGLDGLTTYTFSTWVNTTSLASNAYLIIKDLNNGTCSYRMFVLTNGTVGFNTCNNGFYTLSNLTTASGLITNGSWYHLAITYDGTTVKFFLNGVETTTGSFPATGSDRSIANTATSTFALGGGSSNAGADVYYLDGKMDDTRVYNRALSNSDIYALYNNPGEAYLTAASTEQTPSAASEVLGPSPTLYWEFDQGQGTTAEDATSNGLDGTLNNTPTWQTEDQCIAGKCLFFSLNGNKSVSKSDDDKLDFAAADNFTVSLWMKHPGAISGTQQILTKATGSPYAGYKIYMDASGDLCFDTRDGVNGADSACTSAVDFDDDNWHFVTGVKNGTSSITLYVDGKQRAQDASIVSTGSLANAGTLYAGIDQDGTSNDWFGFIDEVKIYRDQTARTAAQVLADYNARSNPEGVSSQQGNNDQNMPTVLSNGLVGYWKMDETSGNAADSSGNSLTLTNNSTTAYTTGKFSNAGLFVAASTDYFSTATTISGIRSVSFWTYNASTTDEYLNLTSGAYITSSSGTVSATGFTSPSIYVNGTLNGTLTASSWNQVVITTSTAIDANQFEIGRANSAYNNGRIDDVRIYNRTLSEADITQLYNWGPGPVGYWRFDEGTGSTGYDTSGNEKNQTLTSTTYANGKFGKGASYNGSSSGSTNASLGTITQFTVAFWVYHSATTAGVEVVMEDDLAFSAPSFESQGAGSTSFDFWVNNTDSLTTTLPVGEWHHIALQYSDDQNTMVIYKDGVRVTSGSTSETETLSNALDWGSRDGSSLFANIILDDIRVYNYTRTASQVTADMNAGHPAPGSPVSNTVGWWKFNEGADNMCSGGTNDACNSGNAGTTLDGTSTATRTNSGKNSRALDFDGTDDVVTITNATAIDFDTGLTNFTFSGWIYADSAGESNVGQILNKGTSTYLRTDNPSGSNLDIECNLDLATTDANVNVSSAITTSAWNHLACSWDGTTLSVYVNGRLRGSSSSGSGAISTDANNLLIGGPTTANFDGKIDDFKVYNSALTLSQIGLDANAASSQVLGALGNNSTAGALNAASQEYCIPGDSTTCTSPVARWDFEEGTSTTGYDTSGNGNNCTVGSTAWNLGKIGKGTEYVDGSLGASTCGTGSTLNNLQSSGMTVEAWIKPDSMGEFNYGQVAFKGWEFGFNGAGTNGLYFKVNYSGTSLERLTADSVVTLSAWNHVAVTWTGSQTATNAKMYVNGREVSYGSTTNGSGTRDDSGTDFRIGDSSGQTLNFDGIIDQVRVYNYVRTPAQIAYDMNRGAPVGYWKLDDCQGTTVNDSSGFSNTGTWSGSGGTNTSAGDCATSGTAWGDGVTGKRNYSLDFDGTDDVVNTGSGTMLDNLPANGMSFSAWIRPNGLGENSTAFIVDKNTGITQNAGWLFHILATNALLFTVDGSTDLVVQTSNNVWTTSAWNHVALSWAGDITSASSVHIYVNGKEVTYSTQTNGASRVDDASSSFYIGNDSTGARTFDGLIDDVRVFNYALTSTQIINQFNDGALRYGPVTGAP